MDGTAVPVAPEGLDAARPTPGGGRQGRIKVLFFIGSMGGGGAERFYATVLRRLDRGRFEPVLVMIEPVAAYALPDDVRIVVLGKARPWHLPATVARLARAIDRESPDILVSSLWLYNLIAGEALRWSRARPAWLARFADRTEVFERGLLPRLWARSAYPRARAIVANSEGLATGFRDANRALADRVVAIRNPTDFEWIDRQASKPAGLSAPGRPVVIWAGRLARQKRPDLALDAFARAIEGRDGHLLMLGEGPLREATAREVARRGLDGRVTLAGFCANPYAVLARADAFLHSSDHEGLPNALIEAQGLGLAAVATDCLYGPNEIVAHGRTGFLVPVGDAEAIARHLAMLLDDPAGRRAMGAAARRRARERFCWEACGRALEGLLWGLGPARR